MKTRWFGIGIACVAAAACVAPATEETGDSEIVTGSASAALITDRPTLQALEEDGFRLGAVLWDDEDARDTATLHDRHAGYRSYVQAVDDDLAEAMRQDPTAKVGFASSHRIFDARFLRSKVASFDLVGIVNRMDRAGADDCGELRLVYRLGYPDSGLPLTLNVIFRQPKTGDDCSKTAGRWRLPDARGPVLARAAADGPLAFLADAAKRHAALVQVETNFQSVRWPTSVTGEMGGLALYVLRVFHVEGDRFVPRPLENTPDPALVRDNPENKARLVGWIREHASEIRDGVPVKMGEELEDLLATKAVSVAPRSFERVGNRPFKQILDDQDFAALGVDTPGKREHLLRRLDMGTCNGCHQSRSVAGFHLLGEETSTSTDDWLNKLAVGRSPHLLDEDVHRSREVLAIARGEQPPRRAPNPARPAPGRSKMHAHCARPDDGGHVDPALSTWTCGDGQRCDALDDSLLVGSCEQDRPASIGDACEPGRVVSGETAGRDTFVKAEARACHGVHGGRAECFTSSFNGFPGGVCLGGCGSVGGDLGDRDPDGDAVCTLIPRDVTPCVVAGGRLLDCIVSTAGPALAQSCDENRPCRDEYACARVAGTEPGTGACMPPYFLPQVRNDGHVFVR